MECQFTFFMTKYVNQVNNMTRTAGDYEPILPTKPGPNVFFCCLTSWGFNKIKKLGGSELKRNPMSLQKTLDAFLR